MVAAWAADHFRGQGWLMVRGHRSEDVSSFCLEVLLGGRAAAAFAARDEGTIGADIQTSGAIRCVGGGCAAFGRRSAYWE